MQPAVQAAQGSNEQRALAPASAAGLTGSRMNMRRSTSRQAGDSETSGGMEYCTRMMRCTRGRRGGRPEAGGCAAEEGNTCKGRDAARGTCSKRHRQTRWGAAVGPASGGRLACKPCTACKMCTATQWARGTPAGRPTHLHHAMRRAWVLRVLRPRRAGCRISTLHTSENDWPAKRTGHVACSTHCSRGKRQAGKMCLVRERHTNWRCSIA